LRFYVSLAALRATGHDTITFSGDAAAGAVTNENATIGTYLAANHLTATLANDITAVLSTTGGGSLALHGIGSFTFSGDTYLIEQAYTAGTALGGNDTRVHLVGGTAVTAASMATGGILALHG
jgi:hypothetical protein